jgi:FlaA1/EpsC-like NDP-sugar epimerase
MIKEFLKKTTKEMLNSHAPRWIILLLDLGICLFSIVLAYTLRFNFSFEEILRYPLWFIIPYLLFVRALSFIVFQSYAGIVRFTSVEDIERIITVTIAGTAIFVLGNVISKYLISGNHIIPYGVILIDFFITVFFMSTLRLAAKTFFFELANGNHDRVNTIIYGTGEFGVMARQAIDRNANSGDSVIAYIEDKKDARRSIGNKLGGIKIFHYSELPVLIDKIKPKKLIIAKTEVDPEIREEIVEICLQNNVEVFRIPPVESWINGELSLKQIKQVKIEDLLERAPIKLDEVAIKSQCINKIILITGAAGSIGSEIVRQLTKYKPHKLILYDQAESPLYSLELELLETFKFIDFEVILGDVCNENRLNYVFRKFNPQIVYHAAAYKHVPMMESNPRESVATNVMGTKLLADISVKFNVEKFIMISTDKAVNPTSVMGASKRIAELYTQSLNFVDNINTKFITTRFGNVLGSNGSVIPRFREQIERGGPVTITHPDIARYFMTIPEATQLVLEAGAMGNGGEIFIFDMGKLVKIVDLARKMIKLSGLTPGKDIHLTFTGLRPGEKLYEELLSTEENTIPTHHAKILIAKVSRVDFDLITKQIDHLTRNIHSLGKFGVVKEMKAIVPEFISENSLYEELDLTPATDSLREQ